MPRCSPDAKSVVILCAVARGVLHGPWPAANVATAQKLAHTSRRKDLKVMQRFKMLGRTQPRHNFVVLSLQQLTPQAMSYLADPTRDSHPMLRAPARNR